MIGKLAGIFEKRRAKSFLLLDIRMCRLRLYLINTQKSPIAVTLMDEQPVVSHAFHALLEKIRTILDRSLPTSNIAVVMNSPVIRHQMLCIPTVSAKERQKILTSEMRHSQPTAEDPPAITSFWSAGKIKGPEATQEYVLAAQLPCPLIDGLVAMMRDKNLKLIGFTSHAQVASLILRQYPPKGSRNVAMIEVDDREGSIILFHLNIWSMDRHFFFHSNASLQLNQEKLKLEVGRTLQYFKQQIRNESIDHILIYGSTGHTSTIQQLLESSFNVPVVPALLDGQTFATEDQLDKPVKEPPLFGIPHAAALYSDFEKFISFIPQEFHAENRIKVRKLLVFGSAALFCVFLSGIAYLLNRQALYLRDAAEISPQVVTAIQDRAQKLRADRGFAIAAELSDRWLHNKHLVLGALARELAAAAPPQLRITRLQITEKSSTWHIKLEAEIRSRNGSLSQQIFLKFQDQMNHLPHLKQLAWGNVQLADLNTLTQNDPAEPTTNTDNIMSFTMEGILSYHLKSNKP